MLCDECGKNQATYHEIRKINGRRTEVHLCDACRRKNGYDVLPVSGMGDVFGSFDEFFGNGMREDETCEFCGTNIRDFLETGYLGCEHCYDKFSRNCNVSRKKYCTPARFPDKNSRPDSANTIVLKPSWIRL